MLKQGFTILKEWDNSDRVNCHFLVKRKALQMPKGLWHDLWLVLGAESTRRRDPSQPPKVIHAETTLVVDFGRSAAEVLQKHQLPKEFVLGAMLRADEVRKKAAPWPRLKQARVFYGSVASRWAEVRSFGFFVELYFSTNEGKGILDEMMRDFSIGSGLDPVESWDGKIKYTQGFVSRDMLLGKPRFWGGQGPNSPGEDPFAPDK
ncbi:MAG: hypothetical protein ABIP48_27800 [Planctomycetota bacterium]